MSPKQKRPGKAATAAAPMPASRTEVPPSPSQKAKTGRRWLALGLAMAALAALAALYFRVTPDRLSAPAAGPAVAQPAPAGADFVGAAACKSCHEKEYQAWHGSHHRQSMQEATADTVLGDFNNAKARRCEP